MKIERATIMKILANRFRRDPWKAFAEARVHCAEQWAIRREHGVTLREFRTSSVYIEFIICHQDWCFAEAFLLEEKIIARAGMSYRREQIRYRKLRECMARRF